MWRGASSFWEKKLNSFLYCPLILVKHAFANCCVFKFMFYRFFLHFFQNIHQIENPRVRQIGNIHQIQSEIFLLSIFFCQKFRKFQEEQIKMRWFLNRIESFFVNGFFKKIEKLRIVEVSWADQLRNLDRIEQVFQMIFFWGRVRWRARRFERPTVGHAGFWQKANVDSAKFLK